jgi:hypothetical protein
MSTTLHTPLQMLRKGQQRTTAAVQRETAPVGALTSAVGLMERLAHWAERQPPHHRMGSLDAKRHF